MASRAAKGKPLLSLVPGSAAVLAAARLNRRWISTTSTVAAPKQGHRCHTPVDHRLPGWRFVPRVGILHAMRSPALPPQPSDRAYPGPFVDACATTAPSDVSADAEAPGSGTVLGRAKPHVVERHLGPLNLRSSRFSAVSARARAGRIAAVGGHVALFLLAGTALAATPAPAPAPPHTASVASRAPAPAKLASAAGTQGPDHLLLISIDGLSWPTLLAHAAKTPNLQRLLNAGSAGPLESVFPSMTWAAHASILTGCTPRRHGVPGNRYYDRTTQEWVEVAERQQAQIVRTPTLLDAATQRGWSAAALFWPNTGGAKGVEWNVPELYEARHFERQTSPALRQAMREIGIRPELLPRLGHDEALFQDSLSRDLVVHLVGKHRPRAMLAHLLAVDTAGHRYGPTSAAMGWALEHADRLIGDMLAAYTSAGLGGRLLAVVVSDHGFFPVERALYVPKLLPTLRLPRKVANGLRLAANGHALFVYATTPAARDGLASVAAALRALPDFEQVIGSDRLPELGLGDGAVDPIFPNLVALAHPEVLLWNGKHPPRDAPLPMYGMHGHLPGHAALQGVFIAHGAGVAAGRSLQRMRAIDVAPTLAARLGLVLPVCDGRVRADATSAAAPAQLKAP